MIRNEHERRVTQRKVNELTLALEATEPVPAGRDPEMHELVLAGIRTQINQLETEIAEYTNLAAGQIDVVVPDLEELGDQLIRARVAAGLSQNDLDAKAGIAKGTTRRYERERYNNTSLNRLQLISSTLQSAGVQRSVECSPSTEPLSVLTA